MQITITKEVLREQIKILREFLKEKGQDVTQTSCYHLLANMYGLRNWHVLSARLLGEKEND
jgi:hypothetical protein